MADVRILALGTLALLAACASEPTPAEKAAQDARDIAEVEAVQKIKPPPQRLAPEAILFPDIQEHDLFGAGCAFAPQGSMGAVMLSREKLAWMKLEGRLVRFASDPGSAKMPLGTWSRYAGKEWAIALTRTEGDGEASGSESRQWPGRLVVTDAFGQTVFDSAGLVQCG